MLPDCPNNFLASTAGGRSRGQDYRCLPAELGQDMGFCQPTLVPHTSVPDQGQNRNCKNGSGDTPVEDAIMVPSSTGTVGGLSKNSPTLTRLSTYANAPEFPDATRCSNIGHLAYVSQGILYITRIF